jgi:hypothetical protein
MKTLEERPVARYEAAIERFIEEAAHWDGSLPVETFFEAWETIERHRTTLEIQAQVVRDRLVLMAPPESPLVVQDNRIQLEDGREVVITLVPAGAAG